jgi:pyruvate ferredoxin oxidoreductase beta subunit
MPTLKELSHREEILTGGHRLCAGCGASVAVRQVMMGTTDQAVVGCATGCLEVATTIYPYTAWKTPFIHNAFENSAATVSGVEAAYRALQRKGKIPMNKEVKFVAWGGDGGTYDIGLQSLSGAMERGHNMVYVCYDNEAYMNTGIQRSSATPYGASTSTAPAGSCSIGKPQFRKDLAMIMAAHHIPYVGQTNIGYWNDVVTKSEKAFKVEGPAFLLVFAPCPRGWRFENHQTMEIGRLAVETCFWPMYEIENGIFRLTRKIKPEKKKPVIEWLKMQKRFSHLFKPGCEEYLERIQKEVDANWEHYLSMDGKRIC